MTPITRHSKKIDCDILQGKREQWLLECYKGSNGSKTIYLDFCALELQQWDRLTQKFEFMPVMYVIYNVCNE